MSKRRKSITEIAREPRKNPTESEKILWEQLRKRRLGGYRFVRQKPFVYDQNQKKRFFFIADFYCAEKKSVIEVDGPIHEYTQYNDYQRDLVLTKHDLSTLRIKNQELDDVELPHFYGVNSSFVLCSFVLIQKNQKIKAVNPWRRTRFHRGILSMVHLA